MKHNVSAVQLKFILACCPFGWRSRWWCRWCRRWWCWGCTTPLGIVPSIARPQTLSLCHATWLGVAATTIAELITDIAAGWSAEASISGTASSWIAWRWRWSWRRGWWGWSRSGPSTPLRIAATIAVAKASAVGHTKGLGIASPTVAAFITVVATASTDISEGSSQEHCKS